ncbi:1-phosphatidylinositol 3-phosphate 5-kinase [Trichonephila clavipes]|nr:1-phosphatidylinositol 3-phosphate 5-kinase [Trichonephila clavipes]
MVNSPNIAASAKSDAVNIGQAFIHAQLFECIMPQQKFIDGNVFYKPLEQPHIYNPDENSNEIQENNNRDSSNTLSPITPRLSGSLSRLSSSSSMFYLDLDVKESKVSIFKSQHESETSTSSKPDAPATSGTNGK